MIAKTNYIHIVFIFLLSILYANAIEICNNCIDDDGDGLIDCYDPECAGEAFCEGFFVNVATSDTACRYYPQTDSSFETKELWTFEVDYLADLSRQTIISGDIDNDNIVEVLAIKATRSSTLPDTIIIINGLDGSIENKFATLGITISQISAQGLAIADVDGDQFAEIFCPSQNFAGDSTWLVCYEHDGQVKWESTKLYNADVFSKVFSSFFPAIANFDFDDTAEVYFGHYINVSSG